MSKSQESAPSNVIEHNDTVSMTTTDTSLEDELSTLANLPAGVLQIYQENWDTIQTHSNVKKSLKPLSPPPSITFPHWLGSTTKLYSSLTVISVQINYSHYFTLRNHDTNELRFFHASANNSCVMNLPRLINNKADFDEFIKEDRHSDPFNKIRHSRSLTKWELEIILSTCVFFLSVPSYRFHPSLIFTL